MDDLARLIAEAIYLGFDGISFSAHTTPNGDEWIAMRVINGEKTFGLLYPPDCFATPAMLRGFESFLREQATKSTAKAR